MKIVWLKVYVAIASPMTLTFTQRPQVRLKRNYLLTRQYLNYDIQTEHEGRLMHPLYVHGCVDGTLTVMQRSQRVGKGKQSALNALGK